jgi:hypothetical protein
MSKRKHISDSFEDKLSTFRKCSKLITASHDLEQIKSLKDLWESRTKTLK